MKLKDRILGAKAKNVDFGYKRIAALIGCSPNLVKYHLRPDLVPRALSRQSHNRKVNARKLKLQFGGKCTICGYDRCLEALEFHHIDPSTKNKNYSNMNEIFHRRSLKEARIEAEKCALICANCHRELHAGMIVL